MEEKKVYKSFDERKKPKIKKVAKPYVPDVGKPDYSNALFDIGDKVIADDGTHFIIKDIDKETKAAKGFVIDEVYYYESSKRKKNDPSGQWYREDMLRKQAHSPSPKRDSKPHRQRERVVDAR